MAKKVLSIISGSLAAVALLLVLVMPAVSVDASADYSFSGIEVIKGVDDNKGVPGLLIAVILALIGIAFIMLNAFTKKKVFGVLAIVLFAVTAILYLCTMRMFMSTNKMNFGLGYIQFTLGVGALLAFLLMIPAFVLSIIGTVKNKG